MKQFYALIIVCLPFLPAKLLSQGGILDRSFGNNGISLTKLDQNFAIVRAMAIDADGKIVSAGDNYIIRNNADGNLDASFGNKGKTYNGNRVVNAIAIQPDDKIVVAANYYETVSEFTVMRFMPDGKADVSFGENGIAKFPVSANAAGIGLQSDGKIVVAGTTTNANRKAVLVRFNTDGSIDSAFGINGLVSLAPKPNFNAVDIIIQPDDNILAACNVQSAGDGACIYRLFKTGSIDSNFGLNGLTVARQLFIGSPRKCMALQADGKIVIGGSTNTDSTRFGIMRFLPNGKKDSTFARNDIAVTKFAKWFAEITSLTIQTDGKLVAVGSITDYFPQNYGFAAARYLPNGALDNSFGKNGKISKINPAFRVYARCIGLQPGGKIIIGGYVDSGSTSSQERFAFVSRLNNGENAIAADDVKQEAVINVVHVFPNPVKDVLHIRNIPERSLLEIVNSSGVTVISKRSVTGQADVPVSQLLPGIYGIRVINGVKISIKQFLKQ